MKYLPRILFSFAVCSLLLSCSRDDEPTVAPPPQALYIGEGMPIQGDTLVMYYDKNHSKAGYRDFESDLFVNIYVSSRTDGGVYRLQMQPNPKREGLLTARFIVPKNAVFLSFSIGPKNTIVAEDYFSEMVMNKKGEPVESALVYAMTSTRDVQQVSDLFTTDEQHYPYATERFIPYWRRLIENGKGKTYLKSMVDSLLPSVPKFSEIYDQRFTMLCAGAMAYTLLGEYDKSLLALREAHDWIRANPQYRLTNMQKGALATMTSSLTERSPEELESHAEKVEQLLHELCTTLIDSRDFDLADDMACSLAFAGMRTHSALYSKGKTTRRDYGPKKPFRLPLGQIAETFEKIADTLPDERLYFTTNGHYLLINMYEREKRYADAYRVADKAAKRFAAYQALPYADPVRPARCEDNAVLVQGWMLQKADFRLKAGDKAGALEEYKSFLPSYCGSKTDNDGLYHWAVREVASLYADGGMLDSAQKYYAYSVQVGTYKQKEVSKKIDALRSKQKMPPLAEIEESLIKQYPVDYTSDYQAPKMKFATNKGTLSLQRQDSRFYLVVFSNTESSDCRKHLPDLYNMAGGVNMSVVLVTDEAAGEVKSAYSIDPESKEFYLVESEARYRSPFYVHIYPSLFLVRNGRIMYAVTSIGPEMGKVIVERAKALNRKKAT